VLFKYSKQGNYLKSKRKKSLKFSTLLWLLVKKDTKEIFEQSYFKYAHPKKRKEIQMLWHGIVSQEGCSIK